MVRHPKTMPAGVSVDEVRAVFRNEHVHMVLLSSSDTLVGTLVRTDLADAPDDSPALPLAVLRGRTISPRVAAEDAKQALLALDARRVAVVDEGGRLVGLLCLKRRRTGFCSDLDLRARRDACTQTPPAAQPA